MQFKVKCMTILLNNVGLSGNFGSINIPSLSWSLNFGKYVKKRFDRKFAIKLVFTLQSVCLYNLELDGNA